MAVLQTNALTEEQKDAVRALEAVCMRADGAQARLSFDNGINAVRDMDSFFLLYGGCALLGFVSVFAPTREEAEISACVHPAYRMRGYFRRLLACACAEAGAHGYERLLLVHEASAPDGRGIAQKWGLRAGHSEYRLRYAGGAQDPENDGLEVRLARGEDMPAMMRISMDAFEEPEEDARRQVEGAFRDGARRSYIALAGGEPVGICGVSTAEPEQYLFGLGIAARHQGRGYGRGLLRAVIAALRSESERGIALEVDSQNTRAFHLYTTNGFEVCSQYDYYEARTGDFTGAK